MSTLIASSQPLAVLLAERERRRRAREAEASTFAGWLASVAPSLDWTPPHLVLLRQRLEEVAAGKLRRLIVSLPPRHGKSTLAVHFAAWLIERRQLARVLIATASIDLAILFSRQARRLLDGRIQFAEDMNRAASWETTIGGGLRAAGVGTRIVGRGFDLCIVDDPIGSAEDAASAAERERVWEWLHADVFTRREPDAAIVLVMTRWHEDDPIGRLLAGETAGDWTAINLPALADDEDPLDRKPGAALWPARFDAEALEEIRRELGEQRWSSLYQGKPTPREGALFAVLKIPIVDQAPAGLRAVRAWDLAATAGAGDWTAGVKLTGPDADGRFYVVDVVRGRWEPSERNRMIRATAALDGQDVEIRGPQDPGAAGVEAAGAFIRLLAGYSVKVATVTGDKVTRADPLASQLNAGNVAIVRAPWVREYVEELRRFPLGAHDDQVDASADAFAALAVKDEEVGVQSWLV